MRPAGLRAALHCRWRDAWCQQIEEMHATEHHGFSDEIAAEMRKVEECDVMIWHFPLHWFSVPAMLKVCAVCACAAALALSLAR